MHGNQHNSRRSTLLALLATARDYLDLHNVKAAQGWLNLYRQCYATAPASTRRRWKCGH